MIADESMDESAQTPPRENSASNDQSTTARPAPPVGVSQQTSQQTQTQKCAICYGDVNERTILLPCGHADFCTHCIVQNEGHTLPDPETGIRVFRCPSCNLVYANRTRVYMNM